MYQRIDPGHLYRTEDGAFIPRDVQNSDYQEFLAWEGSGNVALPYAAESKEQEQ